MNYTQKLTLSMLVPTGMVAGAGGAVGLGAWWLNGQAGQVAPSQMAQWLSLGGWLVTALTVACVLTCLGFTVWIRRTALLVLGADPSQAQRVLSALAEGELGVAVPPAPARSLMGALATLAERLRESVGSIQQASHTVSEVSGEMAQGNLDLSQRTEASAQRLQQVLGTIQALGESVARNTQDTGEATALADQAASAAQLGGETVARVVQHMQGMHADSQRMRDIIGTIDSIAFQTNILALNAAVEAARASELGRGFAVVAGEVRALATRSAAASAEIRTLISASVDKVEQGADEVRHAGQRMDDIQGTVAQVKAVMARLQAAAGEHRSHVHAIGEAMGDLDGITQQNAALVEESAAAADQLQQQAQRLVSAVQVFRLKQAAA